MLVGERDGTTKRAVSVDNLLRALSCTKRREILSALIRGPMSVTALHRLLGYVMSDVSRHLSELRGTGLVLCEHRKKEHLYRLPSHARIRIDLESILIEVDLSDPARQIVMQHELHGSAFERIARAA